MRRRACAHGGRHCGDQTIRIARRAPEIINAIPGDPVAAWPPEIPPRIMVSRSGEWIPLRMQLVDELRDRLFSPSGHGYTNRCDVDTKANEELSRLSLSWVNVKQR